MRARARPSVIARAWAPTRAARAHTQSRSEDGRARVSPRVWVSICVLRVCVCARAHESEQQVAAAFERVFFPRGVFALSD